MHVVQIHTCAVNNLEPEEKVGSEFYIPPLSIPPPCKRATCIVEPTLNPKFQIPPISPCHKISKRATCILEPRLNPKFKIPPLSPLPCKRATCVLEPRLSPNFHIPPLSPLSQIQLRGNLYLSTQAQSKISYTSTINPPLSQNQ